MGHFRNQLCAVIVLLSPISPNNYQIFMTIVCHQSELGIQWFSLTAVWILTSNIYKLSDSNWRTSCNHSVSNLMPLSKITANQEIWQNPSVEGKENMSSMLASWRSCSFFVAIRMVRTTDRLSHPNCCSGIRWMVCGSHFLSFENVQQSCGWDVRKWKSSYTITIESSYCNTNSMLNNLHITSN